MPVSEVTSADLLEILTPTWHRKAAGARRVRQRLRAALAHVVRNRVEAAYARSDLFERRRVLMGEWARYPAQGIGGAHQVQQGDLA